MTIRPQLLRCREWLVGQGEEHSRLRIVLLSFLLYFLIHNPVGDFGKPRMVALGLVLLGALLFQVRSWLFRNSSLKFALGLLVLIVPALIFPSVRDTLLVYARDFAFWYGWAVLAILLIGVSRKISIQQPEMLLAIWFAIFANQVIIFGEIFSPDFYRLIESLVYDPGGNNRWNLGTTFRGFSRGTPGPEGLAILVPTALVIQIRLLSVGLMPTWLFWSGGLILIVSLVGGGMTGIAVSALILPVAAVLLIPSQRKRVQCLRLFIASLASGGIVFFAVLFFSQPDWLKPLVGILPAGEHWANQQEVGLFSMMLDWHLSPFKNGSMWLLGYPSVSETLTPQQAYELIGNSGFSVLLHAIGLPLSLLFWVIVISIMWPRLSTDATLCFIVLAILLLSNFKSFLLLTGPVTFIYFLLLYGSEFNLNRPGFSSAFYRRMGLCHVSIRSNFGSGLFAWLKSRCLSMKQSSRR